ncbi:MAG: hypothetical protein LBN21_09870, partial [Treponema sp.]|nr:hypothetical protein [Treponema sp.]
GYYSKVSVVMAPETTTDVSAVLFDLNENESLNADTGINTSTVGLSSGQFVFIRVLAELSWLYGGSGFSSAQWHPARSADNYTAYKYYKVRILKEGVTPDIAIADIKYKGTSIGATLPVPITVNTTQNNAYGTDSKKNTIVTTTTTTTWGTAAVDYLTDDYEDVIISVQPAVSTPNVKFAYALAASNVTVGLPAADFNDTGKFEDVSSNNYIVIRATSEDGTNVEFYKIHLLSPSGSEYTPVDIKINNTSIGAVGDGNAAGNGTTAVNFNVPAKAAFESITVTVSKPSPYTAVAFALDSAANTTIAADGWTNTSGIFENVSPGQYVYIRMLSADRTQTRYYKVRLLLAGAQTEAALSDIRINGTSIGTVPAANNAVTGTTAGLYKVASLQNLNNMQAAVTASQGASVAYAIAPANNTNTADWANTSGLFAIFMNAQWLNIRVVSEDGLTTRYYKVRIAAGNESTDLTDIKINGTSITAETPLPAANTAVTGTTSVVYHAANAAALNNMAVTVTAPAGASIAYAAAAANNTNITAWTNTSGVFAPFTAAQWVVIRVISEDTINTRYYKVRVVVGSSAATITGITVNGAGIGTLPDPNTAVTGTTAAVYSVESLLNPVTIAVQGGAAGAVINYAVAAAANTNVAAANFTTTVSYGLTSGQYMVIRVVSQDTVNTNYYKVQVIHGSSDIEMEAIKVNGNYVIPVPQANTTITGTDAGILELPASVFGSPVTVKVSVAPGVNVAYAATAAANTNVANWTNTTGVFNTFTAGQYVVIRVISQNGQNTEFYKVQLTATP